MKNILFRTVAAVLVSGQCSAFAQDLAAGEKLYQGSCRACHGPSAQGMASFPKLSGKPAELLVERLQTYREGEKVGPNSALMIPHATKLTDEDIENIAAYITTSFP
ncbi:c-type cytochrome [Aliihoeflea sp. 40Bstr573]|uniref:c-type cytochrome n=1 Tax=Aliihoeflea sp. 40Bstr573 TaxID=2696467 RepID=UPI00209479EC|nr:c-type cytochrome [Aliihoeflea sp. 40Bstr573]MCO6386398.1 c-type cytochrome [Aliihoeflea sp. 40Bstr573]